MSLPSGISIASSIVSDTIGVPSSVKSLGSHPKCFRYLAICCLLPKLNSGKA